MTNVDLAEAAAAQTTVFHIDPKSITIRKGWNCRDFKDPENKEHVEALSVSIQEAGVKEPLTVVMEGSKPVLVNGESRLRAIQLLAKRGIVIETVPVQVDDSETSEPDKLAEQIIRNSGKQYTVLETAQVFSRLRDLGWDDKKIAAMAGMTLERMRQIMTLHNAPAAVKKEIQKGTVSATMVQRVIASEEGDQAAVQKSVTEAIARAKAEGKSKAGPRHVQTKPKAKAEDVDDQGQLAMPPGAVRPMQRVSAKSLITELLSYKKSEPRRRGKTISVTLEIPQDRWEAISKATY